jgi:predicted DNA-binding protein
MAKKQIALRVGQDMVDRIERAAAKHQIAASDYVRAALEKELEADGIASGPVTHS